VSSRGFTPPDDAELTNVVDGQVEGEPDTKDDEFARDDAPDQEFEEDEA
jgi:hypothetical protein